jgi:uncharacterized DUF497 family protein
VITFEWDPPKAATNLKKHQISFEEARSVFFDEFVCHCERNEGEVIRIISARKATKRESEFYQGGHI